MVNIRSLLSGLFMAVFLLLASTAPASAGWPSAEDVIKKIAPLAGLNGDQVEFVIFALKEPSCAGTIASYTAAQDYSLVAFIAALKATKLQSIPGMPAMSEAQCKAYNPVQQAYIFVDGVGNKLLGAGKADQLRGILKEQIAQGKSSLDAEIGSVPYIGPVLTNWDCECTAAYQTNLASEKTIDAAVTGVISIGKSVKSGDIPGALEKMITVIGPKAACQLGAEWTGVGAIPVVSDIASKACESVAGKAVEWVVSGASTTAQALGIIGGPHIPPEEYYKNMFVPEIGKDGYMELADILYKKCYDYFEASNMSASTAKKVCVGLRAQYVEDSIGKLQWTAFQYERQDYYTKNVKPKAVEAAMKTDAEFNAIKKEVEATCKTYFTQKYPKASAYAKEPIEEICTSFITYSKSQYHPWDMDKVRSQAQSAIVSEVANKNTPFCDKDDTRNSLTCDDQGLKSCQASLPGTCAKTSGSLGGMERPCCRYGTAKSSMFEYNKNYADSLATKQSPYCRTQGADPLRVSCALKQAYDACLKSASWTCDKVNKNPNGTAATTCCVLDPSWIDTVPGVKDVKSFVATSNIQVKDSCGIGGMQKGLSYDPRIANCAAGAPLKGCEMKYKDGCKQMSSGYVASPCCDLSVFNAAGNEEQPYDPKDRAQDDLAAAEAVIAGSHGDCHYGKTADGKEDAFKVVCDTINAAKMCTEKLGRDALTPCSKKIKDGWVTSPCCERSAAALKADARDTVKTDIKAPGAGDLKPGSLKAAEPAKRQTGLGTSGLGTVSRKPVPSGGLNAPKAGDTKLPGAAGGLGSSSSGASTRGLPSSSSGSASTPRRASPSTAAGTTGTISTGITGTRTTPEDDSTPARSTR